MKIITLIRRRIVGTYLIGAHIRFESVMYENRIHFHWTFNKVLPGSAVWQMYKR